MSDSLSRTTRTPNLDECPEDLFGDDLRPLAVRVEEIGELVVPVFPADLDEHGVGRSGGVAGQAGLAEDRGVEVVETPDEGGEHRTLGRIACVLVAEDPAASGSDEVGEGLGLHGGQDPIGTDETRHRAVDV
jgi:hypothetical protein